MLIALIADSHAAARAPAFNANLAIVLADIAARRCDLIIHLGDISADGVSRPDDLAEARALFAAAPAPVLFLPGNHDIGENPPSGVAGGEAVATPFNAARLADYINLFGPDHWRRDVAGWRLIGVNSQLFGAGAALEEAQFSWLAQTIAGAQGPLALFLHKPLALADSATTPTHPRYAPPPQRRRLIEAFAGADLRVIASGHVHQQRLMRSHGVDHVWAPSEAFTIPDAMQESIGVKTPGYALLTLDKDSHSLGFVTPPGLRNHCLSDFPEVYAELAG